MGSNLLVDSNDVEQGMSSFNKTRRSASFVISLTILLLSIVCLVGFQVAYRFLLSRQASVLSDIDQKTQSIESQKAYSVVDYFDRVVLVEETFDDVPSQIVLREVARVIVPGVVLDSYRFERIDSSRSVILISGTAERFDLIAQQIVRLEKMSHISSVELSSSSLNDVGQVKFDLSVERVFSSSKE
ncbi:MAG: hypothetical protein KC736_04385 [Candidatus Moranbacteria bacterium]|nr:hypothetical protein [Candidatus Moranbacteria bacterium]